MLRDMARFWAPRSLLYPAKEVILSPSRLPSCLSFLPWLCSQLFWIKWCTHLTKKSYEIILTDGRLKIIIRVSDLMPAPFGAIPLPITLNCCCLAFSSLFAFDWYLDSGETNCEVQVTSSLLWFLCRNWSGDLTWMEGIKTTAEKLRSTINCKHVKQKTGSGHQKSSLLIIHWPGTLPLLTFPFFLSSSFSFSPSLYFIGCGYSSGHRSYKTCAVDIGFSLPLCISHRFLSVKKDSIVHVHFHFFHVAFLLQLDILKKQSTFAPPPSSPSPFLHSPFSVRDDFSNSRSSGVDQILLPKKKKGCLACHPVWISLDTINPVTGRSRVQMLSYSSLPTQSYWRPNNYLRSVIGWLSLGVLTEGDSPQIPTNMDNGLSRLAFPQSGCQLERVLPGLISI